MTARCPVLLCKAQEDHPNHRKNLCLPDGIQPDAPRQFNPAGQQRSHRRQITIHHSGFLFTRRTCPSRLVAGRTSSSTVGLATCMQVFPSHYPCCCRSGKTRGRLTLIMLASQRPPLCRTVSRGDGAAGGVIVAVTLSLVQRPIE